MLAKMTLKLDALAAANPPRGHLTSPSVLGSRTMEYLLKLGDRGVCTFKDSAGPAVLGPEELTELRLAARADNEAGLVRYLTPKLWDILRAVSGEPPILSLRRLLVNSENFRWLDHLLHPVPEVNRQKPDLYVTWDAFVDLRGGTGAKQGSGDKFFFGPLAHRALQQDGCVPLVFEAKNEPLGRSQFGELVDYHSHLPGEVYGVLFNATDFWLTESASGRLYRLEKCRWHQAGTQERLRQHFAAACRPPRLAVLLARLLADLGVTLKSPGSFLGAGASGRVFAVQRDAGPPLALKAVVNSDALDFTQEYIALKTAAGLGAPVVPPVDGSLKVYDGLGGGYLMSVVGTGISANTLSQIRGVFRALQGLHAVTMIHGDARLPNVVEVEGSVRWLDFMAAGVITIHFAEHARNDMRTLAGSVLNVKADSLPAEVAGAVDLYGDCSPERAEAVADAVWAAKRSE